MTTEIRLSEVAKHKNGKSLWMVIHNDVYDVTAFLQEHPGGEDTLLENAGTDATQPFEDVGHSDDARELLKKYKIGTLPAGDRQKTSFPVNCTPKTDSKPWRSFDGSSSSQKTHSKSCLKPTTCPQAERRVGAIVVPFERRPRGLPCQPERCIPERPPPTQSNRLKWALIALAGAIIIGVVLKKTLT